MPNTSYIYLKYILIGTVILQSLDPKGIQVISRSMLHPKRRTIDTLKPIQCIGNTPIHYQVEVIEISPILL